METRELTCINCPMGCLLTVEMDGDTITDISGYTCPRGKNYAEKEVVNPMRIVTSTVKVEGGKRERVSCKTEHDIPKSKIDDVMREINAAVAHVKYDEKMPEYAVMSASVCRRATSPTL